MSNVHGREALVGAWRLRSWENRADDGQVTYPMGTDALGSLLSTAGNRFSVMISRAGRARFAAGDLLGGAAEEQARVVEGLWATRAAAASMATVSSTMWSCRCSPTGSGPTSSGRSNAAGDRLILSARPLLLAGTQQVPRLVWERVDPSPGPG